MPDGREVQRITLCGDGLTARVLTLGSTLQDLRLDGLPFGLVLGADRVAPYLGNLRDCGALVGRFSNRINRGRFSLDGAEHQLDLNFRGRHCLHGGQDGSSVNLWQIEECAPDRVVLTLTMPDGHMGFPGTVKVRSRISLPGDGALSWEVTAQTDSPTPVSFAPSCYFNLDGSEDASGHLLRVHADRYLPMDADGIPTGMTAPLAGTRFDFRAPMPLGRDPFDTCFCTGNRPWQPLRRVAELTGNASRLTLLMHSTKPGLQLFNGAHLAESRGADGRIFGVRAGIALEPEAWPDAPNLPRAPSAILRPGEIYGQETRLRFSRW